ncbi:unnamed protein product [Bursaphelenchus xylophilus]|uniref:(pine wood nematode) hypothetical protein n=1 Tax=Bursaphelenchus xylophilus TaxID=6326 RepID=A0A1I7RUI3_BURXY|nr:unnamed protein product [Bursaphelenchus xylophilus]CAG9114148.1 unnamed protein product [Bursaphelenchus xylophilus]
MLCFLIFVYASILSCSSANKPIVPSSLSLSDLNLMALCELGYSSLVYEDHGNYCGQNPKGGNATDDIDQCCKVHVLCYNSSVTEKKCKKSEVPNHPYKQNCTVDGIGQKKAVCDDDNDKCGLFLCWCDKYLVDCWQQYPPPHIADKFRQDFQKSNNYSSSKSISSL